MKNLTLILLFAMAPFLTIAQVGTKSTEAGKRKTDREKTSSASYEFMVITGYETKPRAKSKSGALNSAAADADAMMKTEGKYAISFDFGAVKNRTNDLLSERRYRTMAAAVNDAANYGWEFISGNAHLVQGGMTAHYYYMRKEK